MRKRRDDYGHLLTASAVGSLIGTVVGLFSGTPQGASLGTLIGGFSGLSVAEVERRLRKMSCQELSALHDELINASERSE